jgi:hypothetical protein
MSIRRCVIPTKKRKIGHFVFAVYHSQSVMVFLYSISKLLLISLYSIITLANYHIITLAHYSTPLHIGIYPRTGHHRAINFNNTYN